MGLGARAALPISTCATITARARSSTRREQLGIVWRSSPDGSRERVSSPKAPHTETGPRLGDLTLVAREGVVIEDRSRAGSVSVSRHGGLSAREMLVPLVMRVL